MATTPAPSPVELIILRMLSAKQEMFGLQMVEASNGQLKSGTVYVTLGRMAEKGYLTSRQEDPLPGAIGPPRRIYKLTSLGKRVLTAWEAYAKSIRRKG